MVQTPEKRAKGWRGRVWWIIPYIWRRTRCPEVKEMIFQVSGLFGPPCKTQAAEAVHLDGQCYQLLRLAGGYRFVLWMTRNAGIEASRAVWRLHCGAAKSFRAGSDYFTLYLIHVPLTLDTCEQWVKEIPHSSVQYIFCVYEWPLISCLSWGGG